MAQAENQRSFTTISVDRSTADELRDLRDEAGDPNLARTVRRLVDHFEGAP